MYRQKFRDTTVARFRDESSLIANALFEKTESISKFIGARVLVEVEEPAIQLNAEIEKAFGKTGKFIVSYNTGTLEGIDASSITIRFPIKRYVFDPEKKLR